MSDRKLFSKTVYSVLLGSLMIFGKSMGKSNSEKTLEEWDEEIEANPTAENYRNRALWYLGRTQYRNAYPDLQKSVHMDPEDALSVFFLATTLYIMGRYPEAKDMYKKAIDLGTLGTVGVAGDFNLLKEAHKILESMNTEEYGKNEEPNEEQEAIMVDKAKEIMKNNPNATMDEFEDMIDNMDFEELKQTETKALETTIRNKPDLTQDEAETAAKNRIEITV